MFGCNWDPSLRSTGSHRIATFLREEGWDVEVIDFAAHWPLQYLKELVKSRVTTQTKFFGFSSFFNSWNETLTEFTTWIKTHYPHIKIILGGQGIAMTKAPSKNIDFWIDSFGEMAILEVVKSIVGNTSTNLKFDFEHFGDKKLIKSITSYPAFPMKSYKNLLEKRDFLKSYEWLTTEFSRGCKFSCSFCNFPILGVKGDYSRSQEDFELEMRHNYDNFGIKNYYIADETFNDSTEKIIKFADVVDKLNFKPYFSGFIRGDLLITHKESWEHLVRLGMGGQFYGIETFNHKSAKAVKKGMHPDKVKEGLLQLKKYFSDRLFYRGAISLIVGLPFETIQSLVESRNWLEDNWYDQHFDAWPLAIADIKVGDNFTNLSEFSKNLLKYGLRELKNYDEHIKLLEKNGQKFNIDLLPASDSRFKWEHDTMNEVQANLITQKMLQIPSSQVLSNFTLGMVPFLLGRELTNMSEVNNFTHDVFDSQLFFDRSHQFVQEYIINKLNLV